MNVRQATDKIGITSRQVTKEGYLVVPGTLARTGIQEYLASELGMRDANPMKMIRLHRKPEEVFSADSVSSFENKPVTIEHPQEAVTADNWKKYAVGEVIDVRRVDGVMTGKIIIKDKDAIEKLNSGKAELSNGYTYELDMTPGKTEAGEAYDGLQKNIRGNHVAMVDAGRCGSVCRIADSTPEPKGTPMATDLFTRRVTVDGIPLEVSETAAAAIEKVTKDRADAIAAKDAAEARLKIKIGDKQLSPEDVVKLVADQQAEIEKIKKDVVTPEQRDALVADWAALIEDSKRLAPAVDTKGKTCLAIRREVVGAVVAKDETAKAVADAVLGGKKLEAADADTMRSVFNAIAAAAKSGKADNSTKDSAISAALLGAGSVQAFDVRTLWMNNTVGA